MENPYPPPRQTRPVSSILLTKTSHDANFRPPSTAALFVTHELCRRTGLTPELVVEAASSCEGTVPVGMYEFHSYFYDPQPDTLHPDSVAAQLQTR